MLDLKNIVSAKESAAYWTVKEQEQAPYWGEMKFPNVHDASVDLAWIKGAKSAPVMLTPSTFDAKALPVEFQGIEKLSTEMPYFKNFRAIDEKMRQELLRVQASGSEALKEILINRIYDDNSKLLENAALTREILRMQALTTGAVSINGNGQTYSFNYGVPAAHKVSPTTAWTSANADPLGDLAGWKAALEGEGVMVADVIMNSVTLGYAAATTAMKNYIYPTASGAITPTTADVVAFLEAKLGVTIWVYNKVYTPKGGSVTKFVPDGVVVMMPEGALGNTHLGTTPAEADLLLAGRNDVEIVDDGVAIYNEFLTDPVTVKHYVAMICLPSFEAADQIIIADVD